MINPLWMIVCLLGFGTLLGLLGVLLLAYGATS